MSSSENSDGDSVVLYGTEDTSPLGEVIPVGARLPVVMGTGFAFFGPLMAIGNEFRNATVSGAALVSSGISALVPNIVIPGSGVWASPSEHTDDWDRNLTTIMGARRSRFSGR